MLLLAYCLLSSLFYSSTPEGSREKNAKFEVIKLSEKKEMLAATITDNDRIGPSLAVLCSIEQDGASLKIFMTAGIHILICSCVSGSNG